MPDGPGLTEEETWDALEELWEEGKIEHVPGLGDVDEPRFEMTDKGAAYGRQLLRENDEAVLHFLALAIEEQVDRKKDTIEVVEVLVTFAKYLRVDAGVNAFRVIRRNPEKAPGIDADGLSDEQVAKFDPPEEDDA